ncbi:MAG: transposase [Bosea sp.]|nr:transposase [Bosea sp. (in: a-proteobacteria)]MCP4739764.1 transposase [Bosea sp. (in: a-proteobacteria)]
MAARIKAICETRVRYGYRRVDMLLRRKGWHVNQKWTRRIYNELSLQHPCECGRKDGGLDQIRQPRIRTPICLCD